MTESQYKGYIEKLSITPNIKHYRNQTFKGTSNDFQVEYTSLGIIEFEGLAKFARENDLIFSATGSADGIRVKFWPYKHCFK